MRIPLLLPLVALLAQSLHAEPLVLPARDAKGEAPVRWEPSRTALIICDMWDSHTCPNAASRVAEMAPRVDAVAKALRAKGALIIHCPSDTMKFYEGSPQRRLAQSAPVVHAAPSMPPVVASQNPEYKLQVIVPGHCALLVQSA